MGCFFSVRESFYFLWNRGFCFCLIKMRVFVFSVIESFLLWHLRCKCFCLFLRFSTTRDIECQKGTPHPPITNPWPRRCFRNRKRKDYGSFLFLFYFFSKNPQSHVLGLRRLYGVWGIIFVMELSGIREIFLVLFYTPTLKTSKVMV